MFIEHPIGYEVAPDGFHCVDREPRVRWLLRTVDAVGLPKAQLSLDGGVDNG